MAISDSVLEGILVLIYPSTLLAGPPSRNKNFWGGRRRKKKYRSIMILKIDKSTHNLVGN